MAERRAAVFLDRDGVINRMVRDPRTDTPESPYDPADVELEDGAAEAIERLADAGYVLVVASNQPAAAKGIASAEALDAVHDRVVELLGPAAGRIEAWRYCRHHPEAVAEAERSCDCRKPLPGLRLHAADDLGLDLDASWMVGDAERDVEAGIAAGTRTVLVENPDSAHRRTGSVDPDLTVPTTALAISAILEAGR